MDSNISSANIKKTIASVSVLFFLGTGWLLWNEKNADHSYIATLFEDDSNSINLEVDEVFGTFQELTTYNIDVSLLEEYSYTSLVDFTRPLNEFEIGNEVPFVPVLLLNDGEEEPLDEMSMQRDTYTRPDDAPPVRVISVPVIEF